LTKLTKSKPKIDFEGSPLVVMKKLVRDWMLDSNNYRFEYGPANSARGGATSSRYRTPL